MLLKCADLSIGVEDDLQLNQNQPRNKPNQSAIAIFTTVDATGSANAAQRGTKWVLARVSVEVMPKQTSRSHVSDEKSEVEKGGDYLCSVVKGEDCKYGENGEGDGQN